MTPAEVEAAEAQVRQEEINQTINAKHEEVLAEIDGNMTRLENIRSNFMTRCVHSRGCRSTKRIIDRIIDTYQAGRVEFRLTGAFDLHEHDMKCFQLLPWFVRGFYNLKDIVDFKDI